MPGRPASWTTDSAGEIRAALLARPALARTLGNLPLTVERVRALSFVGAASNGGEVGDDCPLLPEERQVAHEVQTIAAALEIAAETDHVVFGPLLAARRLLRTGAIVELPVVGWDVREPLHVVCNGDRVLSRVRGAVVRAVREVSAEEVQESGGQPTRLTGRAAVM